MEATKMDKEIFPTNSDAGKKSPSIPVPISRNETKLMRPKLATTMKPSKSISEGDNQNKPCRNLKSFGIPKQTPMPHTRETKYFRKHEEEEHYKRLLDKYVFCGRSKTHKPEPRKMFKSQIETSSSGYVETKAAFESRRKTNSINVPSSPTNSFEFPHLVHTVPKLYSMADNGETDYEKISAPGRIKISNPNDELLIIAKEIIKKSRNVAINTLALEQTACPYVEKGWLNESKSTWRENEMYRQNRIYEEQMLMEILRRKSTLTRELEMRYEKKLSLPQVFIIAEEAELPEITEEMRDVINNAKRPGNNGEVLVQVRLLKDTISLTRGDIQTVGPSQWLNDNVINTYLGLVTLRSKLENKFPTVYTFQTFFYRKLQKEGYSNSLKRWTRKDDIFAHDLIILPIHLEVHWCLACVDFRSKSIRYFDSLGVDNRRCLRSILDYITKEMKERKMLDLDPNEWSLENVKGIPMQKNGFDCGMFACKFAEYLSRDADFTFSQENVSYYRDRMIHELLTQKILYP